MKRSKDLKSGQTTLSQFFNKRQKSDKNETEEASVSNLEDDPDGTKDPTPSTSNRGECTAPDDKSLGTKLQPNSLDIGCYAMTTVDDSQKLFFLKNNWDIPHSYTFPATEIRGVKRRFNLQWLSKNPWMRYSESVDGVFCIHCVLFERSETEHVFVRTAVNDWANLGTLVKRHLSSPFHGKCEEMSDNFLSLAEGRKKDVVSLLSTAYQQNVERNRNILKSILKTIHFCGKQNIALRGHTEEKSNFIALIHFRAETDELLANHLKNSPPNARYLSPTVQNELIDICGKQIRKHIVDECNTANCFSLIADETTDASTMEQIALCVRYLGRDADDELCLRESLLGFSETSSTTGEVLARTFLDKLREYGVVTQAMRGQGYDGAGNMAGKFSGVQARIKSEIPEAEYVHCYAHCLNLAVVNSCQLPVIRNTMDIVKDISFAFSYSSKRTGRFKTMLEQAGEDTLEALEGRRKIKGMCETRWSSRADALNTFKLAYALIVDTLEDLAGDGDRNARQLKFSITDFGFLVTLVVAEHVLQYSLALSNLLQSPSLDLVKAASEAEAVLSSLRQIRQDESVWQELYADVTNLAATQNILPSKPRTTGRQIHRDNLPADTPEQYWKRSVYYPFLDHITTEIESRLIVPRDRFLAQYLIPAKLHLLTPDRELTVFTPFAGDLPGNNFATYKTELVRWRCKWQITADKPKTLIDSLTNANPELYPNINRAIKVLLTMPVTSATAERSFSALKRVKTYLRSTMVEDRLNGLSLMHIHQDIPLDLDQVIATYAADGNRRLQLTFPY